MHKTLLSLLLSLFIVNLVRSEFSICTVSCISFPYHYDTNKYQKEWLRALHSLMSWSFMHPAMGMRLLKRSSVLLLAYVQLRQEYYKLGTEHQQNNNCTTNFTAINNCSSAIY